MWFEPFFCQWKRNSALPRSQLTTLPTLADASTNQQTSLSNPITMDKHAMPKFAALDQGTMHFPAPPFRKLSLIHLSDPNPIPLDYASFHPSNNSFVHILEKRLWCIWYEWKWKKRNKNQKCSVWTLRLRWNTNGQWNMTYGVRSSTLFMISSILNSSGNFSMISSNTCFTLSSRVTVVPLPAPVIFVFVFVFGTIIQSNISELKRKIARKKSIGNKCSSYIHKRIGTYPRHVAAFRIRFETNSPRLLSRSQFQRWDADRTGMDFQAASFHQYNCDSPGNRCWVVRESRVPNKVRRQLNPVACTLPNMKCIVFDPNRQLCGPHTGRNDSNVSEFRRQPPVLWMVITHHYFTKQIP